MRQVNKNLNIKPVILENADTIDNLKEVIRDSNPGLIITNNYQDTYKDADGRTQSRVREALNIYYHSKCGYCEKWCKAEIEHYRPKARATSGNKTKVELGYFWLCYEWSNLVPSCHECNTSGGKVNQFPIIGTRATAPTLNADGSLPLLGFAASENILVDEKPYLLHPELDIPKNYLSIKIDASKRGICLEGIDTDERGKKTILICNLNRTDLNIARLKVIDSFLNGIKGIFLMLSMNIVESHKLQAALNIIFQQLEEDAIDSEKEYTFVSEYICRSTSNFQEAVLPLFQIEIQSVVLDAFKVYKGV